MNNNLTFEDYEAGKVKPNGDAFISILKKGGFGLSSKFLEEFCPEKPKYVLLKYTQDIDYIYIAFKFTNNKEKNSLGIYYPKLKNGLIMATGFFNKFGINSAKYKGRYQVEQYHDDLSGELIVIKLKK
jgi:hypothetical protein